MRDGVNVAIDHREPLISGRHSLGTASYKFTVVLNKRGILKHETAEPDLLTFVRCILVMSSTATIMH